MTWNPYDRQFSFALPGTISFQGLQVLFHPSSHEIKIIVFRVSQEVFVQIF